MGNERARQKKLAKQKRKRAEVNKKRRSATELTVPGESAAFGRRAAAWPLVEAYIGGGWQDEAAPMLVTGLLVRRGPGGILAIGSLMIDRTCLGIKSGFVRMASRSQLEAMLSQVAQAHGSVDRADPLLVQSIAFHAVDFARGLGFAHDPDFPLEFLGPRPATLLDTPLARPARPMYFAGPDDDTDHVKRTLDRAVGAGNYGYTAPVGAGEEFFFDPGGGELEDGDEGDEGDEGELAAGDAPAGAADKG